MSAETVIAEFAAETDVRRLPDAVVGFARRFLLDAVASALAGHRSEDAPAVARLAGNLFGPGDATVIAASSGLAPAGAAFLNGFKITAATICDVHRPTLTHVGPEVIPAALAAAELGSADGNDLLAGVAVGAEMAVRVAEALDDGEYRRRRWHNPGIAGTIGAAVAAARVLRLDAPRIQFAVGHAASQAAGTFVALGTSGIKFHQSRGATAGLLAAALAAEGFDAAPESLTAPGGLLSSHAGGGIPERLTAGLGTRYRLLDLSLRIWPGASSLQSVVAGTLRALRRADGRSVIAGRVDLPPRGHALHAAAGWSNQLSALQSPRWVVAVACRDGSYWLDQTAPERLRDPATAELAERITIGLDPGLVEGGASITLHCSGGTTITERVDVPPGDPRAPLGDEDVVAKLHRAAVGLGGVDPASILAAVGGLGADAGAVRRLAAAVRARPADPVAVDAPPRSSGREGTE